MGTASTSTGCGLVLVLRTLQDTEHPRRVQACQFVGDLLEPLRPPCDMRRHLLDRRQELADLIIDLSDGQLLLRHDATLSLAWPTSCRPGIAPCRLDSVGRGAVGLLAV